MERLWVPTWQMRLYLRAACIIRVPSSTSWLAGFSTYTCLPACMAQMAARACQWFGVAIDTMSIDLSSSIRRMSCSNFGSWPFLSPTFFIAWPITLESTSQMVLMRQLKLPLNPPTWLMPRPLTPTTATWRVSPGDRLVGSGFGSSATSGVPRRAAIAAEMTAEWLRKERRSSMESALMEWKSGVGNVKRV
jgi:hypothetical protein